MEHETPSAQIFNEIKETAKQIWRNNYSDEFGYVTEKVSRIDSIENYADNVMICYRMFDHNNQQKMKAELSQEAIEYIDENN
jgi:hypothetical protein